MVNREGADVHRFHVSDLKKKKTKKDKKRRDCLFKCYFEFCTILEFKGKGHVIYVTFARGRNLCILVLMQNTRVAAFGSPAVLVCKHGIHRTISAPDTTLLVSVTVVFIDDIIHYTPVIQAKKENSANYLNA